MRSTFVLWVLFAVGVVAYDRHDHWHLLPWLIAAIAVGSVTWLLIFMSGRRKR